MDGNLLPSESSSPREDHEALLEFLYLCPHGLAEFDSGGQIAMLNPACLQLLMPLCGQHGEVSNFFDVLSPFVPDLRTRIDADTRRRGLLIDGVRVHVGSPPVLTARRRGPGAELSREPVVLSLTILRLSPHRLMAVVSDVSRLVAQERRLREAEAWFTAIIQSGDDYAYFVLDAEGDISDWSPPCERLFGFAGGEVLHQNGERVLQSLPVSHPTLAARLAMVRREGWHVAEGMLPRAGGGSFWGTSVISVMRGDDPLDRPEAYLVVVRDTTQRRGTVDELRRALCTDHLTGVANRRHFFERADKAYATSRRSGEPLSAIMVDADHFKSINDEHGHAAGDAVLMAIAAVLQEGVRAGLDEVGRLGGEEFCVLLPGQSATAAEPVAERLRATLAAQAVHVPTDASGTVALRVTASFGVAELQAGATGPEDLLRAADAALYAAKARGRNRVCVSGTQEQAEVTTTPTFETRAQGGGAEPE